MNPSWLLRSNTLGWVLAASSLTSAAILLFSPDGMPGLRARKAELEQQQRQLLRIARSNQDLAEEVRRLAAKDPELYEALARQQGLARAGETVYTFRK